MTTHTLRFDQFLPGRLINRLFVRRDVERIFAHRREVLAGLFPAGK